MEMVWQNRVLEAGGSASYSRFKIEIASTRYKNLAATDVEHVYWWIVATVAWSQGSRWGLQVREYLPHTARKGETEDCIPARPVQLFPKEYLKSQPVYFMSLFPFIESY